MSDLTDTLRPGHPGPMLPKVPGWRAQWLRWALLSVVVLGVISAYVFLPLKDWLSAIAIELRALGALGFVVFVGTYVGASLLLLPAALLSIGAGFAWGALGGFAVAVPCATLAASAAFGISRHGFSGAVRTWLLKRPRLHAVERTVNERGPSLVLLLRLSPVLPFPVLNYLFGLTRIRYRAFGLATFFGMMPITLMWTYVGSIGATLGGLDGPGSSEVGTLKIIVGVVGGLITVGVTLWVGRAARQALREAALHEAAERAAVGGPVEKGAPAAVSR